MSRGPDAATLFARALIASARAADIAVQIVASDWERWASATFTGARHMLTVKAVPCPAFDAWLAALPEADLPIRGHLVADLTVLGVTHGSGEAVAKLEALTVEDR